MERASMLIERAIEVMNAAEARLDKHAWSRFGRPTPLGLAALERRAAAKDFDVSGESLGRAAGLLDALAAADGPWLGDMLESFPRAFLDALERRDPGRSRAVSVGRREDDQAQLWDAAL